MTALREMYVPKSRPPAPGALTRGRAVGYSTHWHGPSNAERTLPRSDVGARHSNQFRATEML
eukprot:6780111-Prymnesium_polylepis.1